MRLTQNEMPHIVYKHWPMHTQLHTHTSIPRVARVAQTKKTTPQTKRRDGGHNERARETENSQITTSPQIHLNWKTNISLANQCLCVCMLCTVLFSIASVNIYTLRFLLDRRAIWKNDK